MRRSALRAARCFCAAVRLLAAPAADEMRRCSQDAVPVPQEADDFYRFMAYEAVSRGYLLMSRQQLEEATAAQAKDCVQRWQEPQPAMAHAPAKRYA